MKQLSKQQVSDLVCRYLQRYEISPVNAKFVSEALIAAEIDGQKGHGLSRLASYVAQAKSGKVNGKATPKIIDRKAAGLKIDVAGGFAFPAFALAIEQLSKMAKISTIAAASFSRSHHCGQAGYHVEKLAERGLIALMFSNTPKAIAPWGGHQAIFGTNPIAFAAPRAHQPPLVIDLGLSKVARGQVLLAQQKNERIPEGWALDKNGMPTTDANSALAGTMLPIAQAKGSALVLMVEVLSAALTGAQFGFEASSFFKPEGEPPGVGQLLIALNPTFFAGDDFTERLEGLINVVVAQSNVRLPGSKRLISRQKAQAEGLMITDALYQQLTESNKIPDYV